MKDYFKEDMIFLKNDLDLKNFQVEVDNFIKVAGVCSFILVLVEENKQNQEENLNVLLGMYLNAV